MTKQELQKEIQDKVKPGVKPSDLKKLKRSKSANDIPKAPPLPLSEMEELKKENNQLKAEIQQTQQRLKDLHDFATKSDNTSSFTNPHQALDTLTSELKKQTDYNTLLQDQLKEQQKELESLREQLETKNTPADLTELDNSLISRHKNLKDWFISYQEKKSLEKELVENIDEASQELISQDEKISNLRQQVSKLKKDKESLVRDLQLASRLAESRKVPYYSPEDNGTYLKYALYSLLAVSFTLWLVKSFKNIPANSQDYD